MVKTFDFWGCWRYNQKLPMYKKLILVDGHALAFRAFHALPLDSFSTREGELTNAVYGFTMMLLRAVQEEKPEYLAVTFDAAKPTFRHEAYKEYKAQRLAMPEEMRRQMGRIHEVIEAFNIPIFEVEGYEADDVIGTLAQQASAQGIPTLVLTGDTDTLQLVSPKVQVITPGGHQQKFSEAKVYDVEAVRERYGFDPPLLVDYKALVGDVSDNIPGVKGIGEKTAKALIEKFGPLENIYAHLAEVEPAKVRRLLEEQKEQAVMSKHLASIVTSVPIQLDLEKCRLSDYDREKVKGVFRQLEFKKLLERLPDLEEKRPAQISLFSQEREQVEHEIIATPDALTGLVERLARASHLTLDVETTSISPLQANLVGIALTSDPGHGYYIPMGGALRPEAALERLRPILEDERLPKWAHNAIYDLAVLANHGVRVKGLGFDTMIAAYLLDPGGRSYGLKDLAIKHLGREMVEIQSLIGKGKKQITMAQVPVDMVAPYAVADVSATEELAALFTQELKTQNLWDLFQEVEMPLVVVLLDMELTGVALDLGYLKNLSREMHLRIVELEEKIHKLAGHPFNLSSPQQLAAVLFKELGLPAKGKTKTGLSTSAEILEELRGLHPIIELVLEHRQLSKLKSTYVDALPLLVNRRTGRVHTSYNQTGTVTGRVSSSVPNLQNIPVRTELGRKVRRAFIAAPGSQLLSADYSQIELRILAHLSQDPELIAAFQRGEDIHAYTATALFGVPMEKVDSVMRRIAKTINFGLIYGMGEFGLAQRTELTSAEATEFIKKYFARYPKVQEYLEATKRKAREEGSITTILGRRRYFPELRAGSKAHGGIVRQAERMAVNMPIQGSDADINKLAMIRLHRALKEKGYGSRMILHVHDELVLEVPEAQVPEVALLARTIMEGVYPLDAHLKVDLKVGKNWEEMEEPILQKTEAS